MSEFAYLEDWSLQAIVRGSSGDFEKIVDMEMDGRDSFLNHQQMDSEFLASFPEIFEGGSSDELEELYKQFYPMGHSLPVQTGLGLEERKPENDKVAEDKQAHVPSDHSSSGASSVTTRVNPVYTPKYKRRKNQHKRVVIQVSAEGLAADMWAWRKYGQKPIKGSPYPRSYYRCSSSKGCLARKQVEQSCTDPGMFIITYTAEHSHSQPTRRNSLAGTIRQKFPSPKSPNNKSRNLKQEKIEEMSGSTSSSGNSPKTLVQEEEDFPKARLIKEEIKEEIFCQATKEDNDFGMCDLIFSDDFFSGLEEFDDFISELPLCNPSAQQFPVRSCS